MWGISGAFFLKVLEGFSYFMGIKNDHKEKRNIIERIEILETQDHQSKQACPLSKKFHHVEEKIAKRRISYVYFFQKILLKKTLE